MRREKSSTCVDVIIRRAHGSIKRIPCIGVKVCTSSPVYDGLDKSTVLLYCQVYEVPQRTYQPTKMLDPAVIGVCGLAFCGDTAYARSARRRSTGEDL